MITEIRSNVRSNADSEGTKSAATGRRIAKQTRVERLRAHEETRAEVEERLESIAAQEIAQQHRLLAADERIALRQLVRQMKKLRGEAMRAELEGEQRAATRKVSATESSGTAADSEQFQRSCNVVLSSSNGTNGAASEASHSRQSRGKSSQRATFSIPNLNKCSDEMRGT